MSNADDNKVLVIDSLPNGSFERGKITILPNTRRSYGLLPPGTYLDMEEPLDMERWQKMVGFFKPDDSKIILKSTPIDPASSDGATLQILHELVNEGRREKFHRRAANSQCLRAATDGVVTIPMFEE